MTRTIALFGPGDFSPWSREVFGRVNRGGPGLVLSFGVVPMGREYVPQLRKMATQHLEALDVPFVAVDAEDQPALDDPANVALLRAAGFVYMQGGSARYIAETLRGSVFLAAAVTDEVPWVATSGATMATGIRAVDTTAQPWWTGDALAPSPSVRGSLGHVRGEAAEIPCRSRSRGCRPHAGRSRRGHRDHRRR